MALVNNFPSYTRFIGDSYNLSSHYRTINNYKDHANYNRTYVKKVAIGAGISTGVVGGILTVYYSYRRNTIYTLGLITGFFVGGVYYYEKKTGSCALDDLALGIDKIYNYLFE